MGRKDQASVADPSNHLIKQAHFNLSVNVDQQTLSGSVDYDVAQLAGDEAAAMMYLDVNNLLVKDVKVDQVAVNWTIESTETPEMGQQLAINVGRRNAGTDFKLCIEFATTKTCSGLQWLPASITTDKKKPFFFSQCQSIHGRSLYPCQDTPMVKFPYTAQVHAPKDFNILLAAIRSSEPVACQDHEDCLVYHYKQAVAIPSYLFAIAGGDIVGRKIGPRSTVWAEPSVVEAAAWEFADCEKMLACAEKLCGHPYEWGVYDILVPPATFPYGGMENPCLTYVTPTLLTGDRSLVNVVAHEIAHSWTGNLVTNDNWDNFWLNEGHTNYLERLIMGELNGPEYRELLISIGFEELCESVMAFGETHEFTKLVPTLDKVHPDDSYSRVPYEKGSFLLYTLEGHYGQERMLAWLRAYVKEFAGRSLSTQEWLTCFRRHFPDVDQKIDWQDWLYSTGMPPTSPKTNNLVNKCRDAARMCQNEELSGFQSLFESFNGKQQEYFFRVCWFGQPLKHSVLDQIDQLFAFSRSKSARIRLGWSMVCTTSKYDKYTDNVFEFLNSMGVMKFVRPIYKALNNWPDMREKTIANFKEQLPNMYPTTARLVSNDLGIVI